VRVLIEPSAEEARYLKQLKSNDVFMRLLRESYSTAQEKLVGLPETEDFRTVQGHAQTLRHLLMLIDPESVEQRRHRR
jgi:hypothetical protein